MVTTSDTRQALEETQAHLKALDLDALRIENQRLRNEFFIHHTNRWLRWYDLFTVGQPPPRSPPAIAQPASDVQAALKYAEQQVAEANQLRRQNAHLEFKIASRSGDSNESFSEIRSTISRWSLVFVVNLVISALCLLPLFIWLGLALNRLDEVLALVLVLLTIGALLMTKKVLSQSWGRRRRE